MYPGVILSPRILANGNSPLEKFDEANADRVWE
jgi:hypothetical protein